MQKLRVGCTEKIRSTKGGIGLIEPTSKRKFGYETQDAGSKVPKP